MDLLSECLRETIQDRKEIIVKKMSLNSTQGMKELLE
jgi:hypothetical protein